MHQNRVTKRQRCLGRYDGIVCWDLPLALLLPNHISDPNGLSWRFLRKMLHQTRWRLTSGIQGRTRQATNRGDLCLTQSY